MSEQSDDLQLAPKLASGFSKLVAAARKREARRRGAERQIAELWQKLVHAFGEEEATSIVSSATGITPAGRPPRHDALDELIDQMIDAAMQVSGSKKVNQKQLAWLILKQIEEQPLTEYHFDEDGDWTEEVVLRHVGDAKLTDRIKKGMKRYKERHDG